MLRISSLLLSLASLYAVPAAVFGQPGGDQLDRRDRREPAIVLNTGGRTGYCDVLKFTPDGKELLGAGDDKSVTIYPVTPRGLDQSKARFLHWPSWREQRGSIFAMDVSADGKLVAIGGYGLLNSAVAILDREKGTLLHLANMDVASENLFAIMSIAFAPSGKQVAVGTGNGNVLLWDFQNPPVRLGRHPVAAGQVFNRVRALQFFGDDYLLSVAESGSWLVWTYRGGEWRAQPPFALKNEQGFRTIAASPASGWVGGGELGPVIQLVSIYDGNKQTIRLEQGEFARSLAFSPDGKRIAAGIGRLRDGGFRLETDESIRIYDLSKSPPQETSRLPHVGKVEALAWHGDRLGVAGGDNHEVALWDLNQPTRPISEARGAGSGVWGVALSEEGRYLAFTDRRDPTATNPNKRGSTNLRYFDLRRRRFEKAAPENMKSVQPIETMRGWSVKADDKIPWRWYAVAPNGASHVLPWDQDQDGRPTCYTFLKPIEGHSLRIAVGHYWGFSLFELSDGGARRTRLYTGHQGEVTSIAPSADSTWVVTGSNDQTISGWNVTDWPNKSSFGATFEAGPDSVRVLTVDIGSPAWEMGLIPKDEIVQLAVAAKDYYVAGRLRTPAEARQALVNAEPGRELFLTVRRPGREKLFRTLSTVRTRPLWRFLPGPDREWVLWTWHGSYYDTSTNGDSLAGWLMNDPSLSKEPRFYKLEQFRDQFQREDVMDELLDRRDIGSALEVALGNNPVPVNLGMNEPPAVRIELPSEVTNGVVQAQLTASARADNVDFQPQRVELWINDYRAKVWQPNGESFSASFNIDSKMLRSGANRLTLQSFNRLGGRSETSRVLTNPNKPEPSRLLGLAVGIDNYASTVGTDGKRGVFKNLTGAVHDVTLQTEQWSTQKGKLYADVNLELRPNEMAARDKLLAELDRLAKEAKPDDLMLVFLSGHGDFRVTPETKPKKPETRFFFCCPNYDRNKPEQTGIDHVTLYKKLAAIPCRKVVFLDACHAGEATFNPVRSLTPGGQGPIILAACDRSEFAFEDPKLHNGLFTLAILNALGDGFKDADRDGNGTLDASELIDAVRRAMPALLRQSGKAEDLQNPQCFPQQPESFPLYRR
jgi:WD40 repeat protein